MVLRAIGTPNLIQAAYTNENEENYKVQIEIGNMVESALIGDVEDLVLAAQKAFGALFEAIGIDIFHAGIARHFFEQFQTDVACFLWDCLLPASCFHVVFEFCTSSLVFTVYQKNANSQYQFDNLLLAVQTTVVSFYPLEISKRKTK